jgi:hypothetical protein
MAKENLMSEFRVVFKEADRNRDLRIRLAAWSTILLLLGATFFGIYGALSSRPRVSTAFTWLAVLIVAGAIVGAYFLALRLGLERVERGLVFVLTEEGLVRKRTGWPDTQIGFAEIKALYQRPGWLLVESSEPRRRIAIPERVEGFDSLRAELVKHSVIVAAPQHSPMRFIPVVTSLVCWGLVLWSRDAGVVMAAGAVALLVLGWEFFRLFGQLRHSPKRLALSLLIGLSWVAAALLVYLRVIRAS